MTLLQFRIALAAEKSGSVSGAAKELNISQPNASNCLRLLEEELGFPVFHRTGSGIMVTQKGSMFLRYAQQILCENDKILRLRGMDDFYRLHLGTVNYYAAVEPFFRICYEHRDDPHADFKYSNVSLSEGIQDLNKRTLDIVTAPVMKQQLAALIAECEKNNIEMTTLCTIPAVIEMRKGHPATADPRIRSITQGCDTMKDYPYIGLQNLSDDNGSTRYNDSDFVQCSYKMFANDTHARLRMIESTNGFGFGVLSTYKVLSQYSLSYFPVPGMLLDLICMYRPGDSERHELQDYIFLLNAEMETLVEQTE